MAHVANITIQNGKVAADLTDYPVYIDLSDLPAGFWDTVTNGGGDIRVYKSDGTTELAREVVSCDTSDDTGEIHVKYSGTLSSSSDTVVQIHADGSSTEPASDATYGSEAVWSDYELASHDGGGNDSTSNGNDGSGQGGISIGGAVGQIGSATDFDGTDDYISISTDDTINFDSTDSFSIDIWFKTSDAGDISLFDKTLGDNQEGYRSSVRSDNHYIESSIEQADNTNTEITGGTAVNDGEWHKFTFVRDVSEDKLYVYLDSSSDATPVTDTTTASLASATALLVGAGDLTPIQRFFDGIIDEFRIIKEVLSSDWIATEYNNQSDVSTFYTASAVGYTMIAEQGSFTLTGQDINLLRGLYIEAEQGSFTLTGQDVDFKMGYGMIAEYGSFALTGQDVNFRATRKLVADYGSFVLTGQDVNFGKSYSMIAGYGAFTLTGQDISFYYDGSPWTNDAVNSTAFTNEPVNSTTFTNLDKK